MEAYASGSLAASVAVGAGATSTTVPGLLPGHSYRFRVATRNTFGLSGWSALSDTVVLPPADVTPFAGASALVTRQYLDFVGRAPSPSELSAGVTAITTGAQSSAQWVAAMRDRPEWGTVRAPIIRLYSAYFLRLPDASGLAYWSSKVRAGTSLTAVSDSFAASKEFTMRYGTLSNAAFVALVYQNVLGRAPDSSGSSFWVGQLSKGKSRGYVMGSMSESKEHIRLMAPTVDIVLLYTAMLRRSPTPTELADALDLLAGADVVSLTSQLLHLPAYAARL